MPFDWYLKTRCLSSFFLLLFFLSLSLEDLVLYCCTITSLLGVDFNMGVAAGWTGSLVCSRGRVCCGLIFGPF